MNELSLETLKADIAELEYRNERRKQMLERQESRLAAMRTVLDMYSRRMEQSIKKPAVAVDLESLLEMKMEQAVMYLAEKGGGELNSTEARELLVKAGIISSSNPNQYLWRFLKNSEKFESVGRGRWRLVDPSQQTHQ